MTQIHGAGQRHSQQEIGAMGIGAVRRGFENYFTCMRSTVSQAVVGGVLTQFAADQLVRYGDPDDATRAILRVEPAATNLLTHAQPHTGGWVNDGSTHTVATPSGGWGGWRVASQGQTFHRARATVTVTSGQAYAVAAAYRVGSSGRVGVRLRNLTGGTESAAEGVAGAVAVTVTGADALSNVMESQSGDVRFVTALFVPNFSGSMSFGVGPASATVGEDIVLLAGQVEQAGAPTSLILSSGAMTTRAADRVTTTPPVSGGAFSFAVETRVPLGGTVGSFGRALQFSRAAGPESVRIEANSAQTHWRVVVQLDDGSFATGLDICPITPGVWQRIAVSLDGATARAIANGVAEVSAATAPVSSLAQLSLGSSGTGSNVPEAGIEIREIVPYGHALDSAELAAAVA